jgi:hypothetical protein
MHHRKLAATSFTAALILSASTAAAQTLEGDGHPTFRTCPLPQRQFRRC